jgi:hypothetical protein
MATLNAQLTQLVSKFANDLEALFREQALVAVRSALGDARGGPPARVGGGAAKVAAARGRRPAASKKAGGRGKRVRRTAADLARVEQRIVEHVRKNPGQRAEQIKKALGLGKKDWMLPVSRLIERGSLKSKGEKRSTTYSA